MNYGGFGGIKETQPDSATLPRATEEQKPMNYGGFGQRRDPSNSGDSKQPESASPSAFGGSKFGGFKMPGASTVYGNKANFNPLDQFRSSMLSVLNAGLKPAEDYERIYRNSITSSLPSQDYLKQKRSSVFHKAFDSG